ncbi:arsenate reductase ArsC [Prosthecochloris sp. N3]|uniref:Arsenate reductase ArsC n=1 Tax=Prosthecochloris ethylica TaxID=2743976 RepID=A0ABR9XT24_9CHLB|nr:MULTISPECIES: arsenate reductase ArsC [Prosthecochloris]MEC9486825.1 arsenate reductase ArsC [Prosthecochloris sp.]MBF0585968.1 arsenate reductase ArsC [Prosthecochloris ethylica]MBF0637027.1 arsenate reductase ArsC [Prosthecochloris ethylica]NUK47264.1 arsenate reductase ArsC [Prosthecochloris ethylica]RNA64063.1 arsenate reductase ArsC [Prosthecochloris sp. ZM_2]
MTPRSILILCTGNSCRSQMAAGFLRSFDPGLIVRSAGTRPAERVHPLAVDVMQEKGIDISAARPESVDRHLETSFDYVITVCDGAQESCPMFTGTVHHRLHIGFEDPALAEGNREEQLAVFRRIRDEIEEKFREFYRSINNREDTP